MFNFTTASVVAAVLCICFVLADAGIWVWALSMLLYVATLAYGSFAIQKNFFLPSLSRIPDTTHQLAITFDDGPSPETLEVLRVLAQFNAKATFFCIGRQVESHPDILIKIFEEGHMIGNHTYSHKHNFPVFTVQDMVADISRAGNIIRQHVHKQPVFFRPPFGVTNPRLGKALKELQLRSVGWNKRSFDTVLKNEQAVFKRVTENLKPGDIILFHDNLPETASHLEKFLSFASEQGYTCERLDKLLKTEAYA